MSDLLGGLMTAAELMAMDFGPESGEEFRAFVADLVASGECHPMCLFGMEASGRCACRCEGLHHGLMTEERRT